MRVFIGSSSEASDELDLIASWIEDFNHEPIRWNDLNLFRPGSTIFQALADIAKDVDAAILIFSEDDKIWYRQDTAAQPRDNVLIEYGLFLGSLGTGRVIFCRKGNPKTADDLLGVIYVDISKTRQTSAKIKIRGWLEGIQTSIMESYLYSSLERLKSPFQALGKQTLFLRGTELIKQSKHRVALVARTPIPIVGTRPYDRSGKPPDYEYEQFNAYLALAKAASGGEGPSFRCVADIKCLRKEIINEISPNIFLKTVNENLTALYDLARTCKGFQLRWQNIESNLAYMVSDDDFIIWFKDRTGENVWITARNQPIANALYFISERDSFERPQDDILIDLGI